MIYASRVLVSARIDTALEARYPGSDLHIRHASMGSMPGFEVVLGERVLCWIDGEVLALIAEGDSAGLETVFDEVDSSLKRINRRAN